MNYVSSIVSKYGDTNNARQDSKALREILERQGVSLLIDVLADHVGVCANNHKLTETERNKVRDSMLNELRESINERI